MKFCTRVGLKPSNDRCEFELDQARSKNNIAENSIALGHDTHNRRFIHKPFRLSLDAFIRFHFLRIFCFQMVQPRHFYLKIIVQTLGKIALERL